MMLIKIAVILVYLLLFGLVSATEQNVDDVDIRADKGSTNLSTSISRLQGNVLLKHKGIIIKADAAEVQDTTEKQLQTFAMRGQPLTFYQSDKNIEMSASAQHLVYVPDNEEMELDDSIAFSVKTETREFEILADSLKLSQVKGKPENFIALGQPVEFKQQFDDKMIRISAVSIEWSMDEQIAIMKKATLEDGQTTFSAAEISYSTKTGEISASSDGKTRPNYRFTPDSEKENKSNNDT